MPLFLPLTDLHQVDLWQGGESAHLLWTCQRHGIPVPETWVVTTTAFEQTLQKLTTREPMLAEWPELLWRAAHHREYSVQYLAKRFQKNLMTAPLPFSCEPILQAVRSPLLRLQPSLWFGEDQPTAPWANLLKLPVCWAEPVALESALKALWADLLSAKSLSFWGHLWAQGQGGFPSQMGVAVLVQSLEAVSLSGRMTLRGDRFDIEAVQGLPEAIATSCPDQAQGSLAAFTPLAWTIGYQELHYQAEPREHDDHILQPCLTTTTATGTARDLITPALESALWHLGRRIQTLFPQPLRVDWHLPASSQQIQVTQGYGWPLAPSTVPGQAEAPAGSAALVGYPAAPGSCCGIAQIILPGDPLPESANGNILVTTEVSPDWLPLLKTAGAIVSERGGLTSHAAVLAREMGVPAVVGVAAATVRIQPGDILQVEGDRGLVTFLDNLPMGAKTTPRLPSLSGGGSRVRLWLNLSQPELADRAATLPVAGVGLLRSEWLMMSILERRHPYDWVQQGDGDALLERLVAQLRPILQAFRDRPVRYRTLDIRSNEFSQLLGAPRVETNPMLGLRGTLSYQHYPDFFRLELTALKRLQREGYSQIQLLLPFVRTVEELSYCQSVIQTVGLASTPGFQLWLMAEVPSVLFLLPQYAASGIAGIAIGSHDLTQLLLGIDRDQPLFSQHFDETHPAVQAAIAQLIQQAKALNLSCCLCGVSAQHHPTFVKAMIQEGITDLSVDLAAVEFTARLVQQTDDRP